MLGLNSIIATKVNKKFKDEQQGQEYLLFNDLNLRFYQSCSYGIAGPSGSGKTTLLHLMAGVLKPCSGVISTNKRLNLGIVFQQPLLIDELSVLENIITSALLRGHTQESCRPHALTLLEKIGLKGYEKTRPKSLSIGQQQRVSLARALFCKPDFLIADEPTAGLDSKTAQHIVDLILFHKEEYKMGIIIGSHDLYLLEKMEHILDLSRKVTTDVSNCQH